MYCREAGVWNIDSIAEGWHACSGSAGPANHKGEMGGRCGPADNTEWCALYSSGLKPAHPRLNESKARGGPSELSCTLND